LDENASGEKAYEAQNKGEADAEQHSAEEDGEASNEQSFQEDAIRTCYDAEGDIEHVQEMETKEVSAGVYAMGRLSARQRHPASRSVPMIKTTGWNLNPGYRRRLSRLLLTLEFDAKTWTTSRSCTVRKPFQIEPQTGDDGNTARVPFHSAFISSSFQSQWF